ncbi:SusC/RagA family TonB-linked outer membrane protein [uncultured Draconibacterium sp.]|uniref:SusC/RagA family TonB-linked outer membrane protein n=1 Tax=uncultured Draconibacterium sp. TaxID=1573823 RepID=UPI0029C73284|nr:SusC/RagA family TonB-linked outer membrane protein [uncultured Draconibacterium sp.]
MMKRIYYILSAILFMILLGTVMRTSAQESEMINVESVVLDSDGSPLVGVAVLTADGKYTTETSVDGTFTIEIPKASSVKVSGKGYKPLTLSAYLASMPVFLEKLTQEEDVQLPFTVKTRKSNVSTIYVLRPDELSDNNSLHTVTELLQNRVPGLRGQSNIRGIGEALYVVDGVPRPAFNLNLEEVEEITVLKDVHAALLYGAEAQNGVILIKTKRGRAYQNKVNAYAETGISSVRTLPTYLNSSDYMKLRNEALMNDGAEPQFSDEIIAAYASGKNPYRYPDVDYYSSEYINNTARFNRVVTEFSGGNENTQYYANLGWTNNDKLYALGKGNEASTNRFNVRANSNFKINDFIKGYLDGVFIFNVDKDPVGNFWQDASNLHPYYYSPLIPIDNVKDESILRTAKTVNGNYLLGGTNQYQSTVYGNMFFGGNTKEIYRHMQFNNGLEFNLESLVNGLTFRTNLSFDLYNEYQQSVRNNYAVYSPTWVTASNGNDSIASLTKIGDDLVTGNQDIDDSFFYRRIGFFGTFEYNRTFNRIHSLNATFIGYFNRQDNEGMVVSNKNAHLGLRLAYGLKDKYFADFSSTLTNSIKLPEGKRAGFSPSLALGWILSKEDFLIGFESINFLKLTASAGILKTDIGINDYYLYNNTFYRGSSVSWNDKAMFNSVVKISRAENQNLTFQQVKNLNLGLEGYFFNNAIGVDVNFFTNERSGDLMQRSIYPTYLGTFVPYENYGAVSYTGADMGVNYNQKVSSDLSFDLGFNMMIQNSKIKEIDEQWEYDYQYRQGRANDLIFGLESLGFFADSTDIANSPQQAFGIVRPGDIKYKDQNGDEIIDQNDAVEIGHWRPRVSYGVQLGITYKNFNLNAIGGGQAGAQSTFSGDYFWVDGNDKYSEVVLNRWTPQTANTATYPRLSSGTNSNNYRNSTFWLETSNNFNLDQVQITYDLGKRYVEKLKIKDASIYLRGQNLLMIAKDVKKREIRINSSPLMRSFAIGLRMKF